MARTPLRALRIADDLWAAAQARAAARGESVSEVLRAALRDYVDVDDAPSARLEALDAAQDLLVAQGIVMERFGCATDEARARLRRVAETEGRPLNEVVVEVIRDATSSPAPGLDQELRAPRSRQGRPIPGA